tara:strand:+ start:2266 stop:2451 length:186 start_codon:yes stop_codon:yes gene_type:complete
MFKIKEINNKVNVYGYTLVILWLFSISVIFTIEKGDHIQLSAGIGPFEVSFSVSLWRKLLP